ncbi:hypothetical protein CXX84_16965 [Arthrobacter sp. AFG7.2]|uniref:hypothetical protein n=1 Tax=Arthrobacter sp. AFG7.2 TaxID=1688693 RepID=UPI000C9E66DA|nr:hypothetical protein [Arthrobacter sp. AFG7.2]PNI07272.1 hypothetical protein CXX84_16965 [Arthrobacter sp. AFG7.2]
MTARASVLPAALLRAGLLAAVFAIVAGIFGMHVMTADHSSHASSVAHAGAAQQAGDAAVGHSGGHDAVGHSDGHAAVGHPASPDDAGAATAAWESCSAGCPGAQEAGSSCIPSAQAGSLAVIPPQAGPAVHPGPAPGTSGAAGYSYFPSSPTPCELSISRT